MTIKPPDSHHLSAAVGWLELGNSSEALNDLDRISSSKQVHPEVLEVRWAIYAKAHDWEKCVEVAKDLTRTAPKKALGWIHLSFALHELKQTRDAHTNLTAVLDRFPNDWLMRYNLACYACQLGEMQEAGRWLAGAMLKGKAKQIKRMAQDDPDLQPLFKTEK